MCIGNGQLKHGGVEGFVVLDGGGAEGSRAEGAGGNAHVGSFVVVQKMARNACVVTTVAIVSY